jgi:hypothetical protein
MLISWASIFLDSLSKLGMKRVKRSRRVRRSHALRINDAELFQVMVFLTLERIAFIVEKSEV